MRSPEHYQPPQPIEKQPDLLQEQLELTQKLSRYDYLPPSLLLKDDNKSLSPEEFEKLKNTWIEKVRQETKLLSAMDDFGVRLFEDNPLDTKKHPNVVIKFLYKQLHLESLVTICANRGELSIDAKHINLVQKQITPKTQMRYLLEKGKIHEDTTNIVHEAVHATHYEQDEQTPELLSEIHAFFSEVYCKGNNFDSHELVTNLVESYNFDKTIITRLITCFEILKAAGKTEVEISQLIIDSRETPTGRFEPFETVAENLQRENNLTLSDIAGHTDQLQQQADIDLKKAQLFLFETIHSQFSPEQLKEKQIQYVRNHFTPPARFEHNQRLPDKYTLTSITPDEPEFPYDPTGKTSGIVLGEIETEKNSRNQPLIKFRLGRYDAENNTSKLTFAETEEEQQHYLELLRKHSPQLSLEQKKLAYNKLYVHRSSLKVSPLLENTLRAILRPEDIKEILTADQGDFEDELRISKEQLKLDLAAQNPPTRANIYTQLITERERLLEIYKLSWTDVGGAPNLSETIENIKETVKYVTNNKDQQVEQKVLKEIIKKLLQKDQASFENDIKALKKQISIGLSNTAPDKQTKFKTYICDQMIRTREKALKISGLSWENIETDSRFSKIIDNTKKTITAFFNKHT